MGTYFEYSSSADLGHTTLDVFVEVCELALSWLEDWAPLNIVRYVVIGRVVVHCWCFLSILGSFRRRLAFLGTLSLHLWLVLNGIVDRIAIHYFLLSLQVPLIF